VKEEKHIFLKEFLNFINNNIESFQCDVLPINAQEFFKNNFKLEKKKTSLMQYPDFGLYIYNKKNYLLTIRCGNIGQKGKGGHSHNDQLSFTLQKGINKIIVDSGTYTYTSNHKLRNKYRSTSMHNTLQIEEIEQNDWFEGDKDDLFWLITDRTKSEVISVNESEFIGMHNGFGVHYQRRFILQDNMLTCQEICEKKGLKKVYFHFQPSVELIFTNFRSVEIIIRDKLIAELRYKDEVKIEGYDYSPMYGILIPAKKLTIESYHTSIEWQIEINTQSYDKNY